MGGEATNTGDSPNRSGEDIVDEDGKEAGRADTGTNAAGRPTGESDERDTSGVNTSEGITDSPPMGGQGG